MQAGIGLAGGRAAVDAGGRHLSAIDIDARHAVGAVDRGTDAVPLAQLHHAGRAAEVPEIALPVRIDIDLAAGAQPQAQALVIEV